MPRRPTGHVASQRKLVLALALCLIPALPLVTAQQQHDKHPARHQIHDQARHPIAAAIPDNDDAQQLVLDDDGFADRKQARKIATGQSPPEVDSSLPSVTIEEPQTHKKETISQSQHQHASRKHNTHYNRHQSDDASALATLAPDVDSVRAPLPPHRVLSDEGHGLATPHSARSLGDWEVEDFVLLATVDGDLMALERKTGKIKWTTKNEVPVVETVHHRLNASLFDKDYHPIDRYIWAIEPSADGEIYIAVPSDSGDGGLFRTQLNMKKLVGDMSPLVETNPPVVYVGTKESTVITLNADNGRPRGHYGSASAEVYESDSCNWPDDFTDPERCASSGTGTIVLGRTTYVVVVRRRLDGAPIATLRYSEWSPNQFDKDLFQQYRAPLDSQYITSKHTGEVYAIDVNRVKDGENPYVWYDNENVATPVARVFDIARPRDAPASSNPQLLVLPQPIMPAEDNDSAQRRKDSTYLSQAKDGSWIALSAVNHPLVLDAAAAPYDNGWDSYRDLDPLQLREGLTGLHSLVHHNRRTLRPRFPTLDAGMSGLPPTEEDAENNSALPALPEPEPDLPANVIAKVKEIPQVAANNLLDFLSNPFLFIIIFLILARYQNDIRRGYARSSFRDRFYKLCAKWFDVQDESIDSPEVDATETLPDLDNKAPSEDNSRGELSSTEDADVKPVIPEASPRTDLPLEGVVPSVTQPDKGDPASEVIIQQAQPEKKKKRTHRGRRGGVNHKGKNGTKKPNEPSSGDDQSPNPGDEVDEAVRKAQKIADQPRQLEPDIMTLTNDVQEVSGPMIRMGKLEVDEDKQLGTGSNGTVVFAGNFDGRAVAVKRMLIQFYDIASQETKLLKESDDHANVIRYYTQEARGAFLYIALELCEASLADIMEKPHLHRELAQAGEQDLTNVLYQITNGIHYLHSLRIVHRDLKPQNILVNMGKDGRPRLLVSDFGLCKKLEGGQSSFGATTAHAAGTSGWRAPELLLDDDARDPGTALLDANSTHSGSGLANTETMSGRRVRRSIDIFSLGLVYYYVLTKGSHPYDCGDRYMREVNIRKDQKNLDGLDALGDVAEEAKDLVGKMLDIRSGDRPPACEVMSHPFFWSSKRRLAFLCDVSDQFEHEVRDPPSPALQRLEERAMDVTGGNFLQRLPQIFVDSLGRQRKYTGNKMLDLLRALRNKRNHYEDMDPALKDKVGPLPDGYLGFWTRKFPVLLIYCWKVVKDEKWNTLDRFKEYYEPANLS